MTKIRAYVKFIDKWFDLTSGLFGEGLEDLGKDVRRASMDNNLTSEENEEFGYVIAGMLHKTQREYLTGYLLNMDKLSKKIAYGIIKNEDNLEKVRKKLERICSQSLN